MTWYMYIVYSIPVALAVLIIFSILLYVYIKLTTGKCNSNVRLDSKTAIVTGANTGIGYETALDFAERGAKVILACRDQKRGQDAVDKIIKKANNKNVFFKPLDLSSIKSVKDFSEDINNSENRLDILVNNAGALGLPNRKTDDGFLLMMQTNYFGPFLLTILLLNLMKKTCRSRIVNVSSVLAKYALELDVNNLDHVPRFGVLKDLRMYIITKLCNILFTIKLAEKLKGTDITTYSLHPGAVTTEIDRNKEPFISALNKYFGNFYLKNPREGAETTIYCSIVEGIEHLSGQHFEDCHVVRRYRTSRDPDLAEKLWKATEERLNLNKM